LFCSELVGEEGLQYLVKCDASHYLIFDENVGTLDVFLSLLLLQNTCI
jgi:hypothetical protein